MEYHGVKAFWKGFFLVFYSVSQRIGLSALEIMCCDW